MDLEITPHNDYLEQGKRFYEQYELIDIKFGFESNRKTLIARNDRVCRFCGKKASARVKFRKDAHLISELVGNKQLFNDFECDDCNLFFGKAYENDLANFLGISRSLTGLRAKEGFPKFKSADRTVTVRAKNIQNAETVVISTADNSTEFFKIDPSTGLISFTYRKNSYVPLNVYLIILKWAMSVLTVEELKIYKKCLTLLKNPPDILSGCVLTGYRLPLHFALPVHYMIFKKKDPKAAIHTHLIAFYFQNFIVSIPIPFGNADQEMLDRESRITVFPPLFTQFTTNRDFKLAQFVEDFSSRELIKDEIEEVVTKANAEELKQASSYHPEHGFLNDQKPEFSTLKSLIIRRNVQPDDVVDPKTFYEEIRTLM